MGQAAGAWFKHPETPTLIFLGTSLPQLFLAGFSWPREAIPEPVQAAGYIFPSDFAIDGIVRIDQLGASLWEVVRDWRGLWLLAAHLFRARGDVGVLGEAEAGAWLAAGSRASSCSAFCWSRWASAHIVLSRPAPEPPIVGVVRTTEVRVAPEVGGQLAAIKVQKGDHVRAGDVVAELSALELTAAVGAGARGACGRIGRSRPRLCRRARRRRSPRWPPRSPRRRHDWNTPICSSTARPSSPAATTPRNRPSIRRKTMRPPHRPTSPRPRPITPLPLAGPTKEERSIADAQVKAAAAALAVLERRLDKTILRAPADGVVSVIVAEVGENVRAGEPVLVIEETGKRWLSFNAREDLLHGMTVGSSVEVTRPGANEPMAAVVTEVVPLGPFATWQAERAIGDHDRNTLRLRLDPKSNQAGLDPGMTVWIVRSTGNGGARH